MAVITNIPSCMTVRPAWKGAPSRSHVSLGGDSNNVQSILELLAFK